MMIQDVKELEISKRRLCELQARVEHIVTNPINSTTLTLKRIPYHPFLFPIQQPLTPLRFVSQQEL